MKTPNPMGARSMRHNEMELIAMTDKQTPSAEQFAHKINVVAGRSVRAAVMLGRLFLRAKENLPHGQWGRLFKGRGLGGWGYRGWGRQHFKKCKVLCLN